ncbi:hypothetical protein KUTeg_021610 [Tegillarca granosa]|uniref:Uncharacterized protein n=1 Tax=Tegillarca granosa TaxID=220873 RepID=A0ABQ9E6P9_TEGGR|nr:hypothetical protein KUTeg_021610 [Tegillarca granosa]
MHAENGNHIIGRAIPVSSLEEVRSALSALQTVPSVPIALQMNRALFTTASMTMANIEEVRSRCNEGGWDK